MITSNLLKRFDGGVEGLAAFEKVLPGIGTGENFLIIADIEFGRIEGRANFGPGESGMEKEAFGRRRTEYGSHYRLGKTIAVGVEYTRWPRAAMECSTVSSLGC